MCAVSRHHLGALRGFSVSVVPVAVVVRPSVAVVVTVVVGAVVFVEILSVSPNIMKTPFKAIHIGRNGV